MQIDEMRKAINDIRLTVHERASAIIKTGERADSWFPRVKGLRRQLERIAMQMPNRAECFFSENQRQKKEDLSNKAEMEVRKVAEIIKLDLEKCRSDREVDVGKIAEGCDNMIAALGYHPEMEISMQNAVQEAIRDRKALAEEHCAATRERTKNDVEIENQTRQMSRLQSTFDMKMSDISARITCAQDHVHKNGQGVITMNGSPPESDPLAQELYNNWMSKRWDKLVPYKSGWFSIVIDANLTKRQQDALKEMNTLVDQADELKRDHQEKIHKVETEKKQLMACRQALQDQEDEAKKECDESQRSRKSAQTFHEFKLKFPVEYGQITLLSNVTVVVGQAALWLGRVNTGVEILESLLNDLESQVSYSPEMLLHIVGEMVSVLDDSDTSAIGFFRKVGGVQLRKALFPAVQHGQNSLQEVQNKLNDFQETEQKALAWSAAPAQVVD